VFLVVRRSSQRSTYIAHMALRKPSLILITWNLPVYYLIRGWVLQGLGEFRLGYVTLRYVGSTVSKICFVFDFILHTAYTVEACALTSILPSLSLIDMVYCTPDTSDASVGSGRRRRFFDWYGFRFSTTLWDVFVLELRDSIVFSVVQTVMEFERIGWV
jgi:hypothetical protein